MWHILTDKRHTQIFIQEKSRQGVFKPVKQLLKIKLMPKKEPF